MRSVSKAALGAALALGVALTLPLQPAGAQYAPSGERFSSGDRAALLALQTALEAKNYAAAQAALDEAQSRARTGEARYLASALQLRLGIETSNLGLQSSAIDAMISSGAAPASELPQLYRNQAAPAARTPRFTAQASQWGADAEVGGVYNQPSQARPFDCAKWRKRS